MSNQNIDDVLIIGGGPVGLFAAFYGGLRQMSVKMIESLPQLGGQLSALYPEKYIYDIAGFPKIRAQELVDNLIQQMQKFEQTICLEETVENVIKNEDGIFIVSTNKDVHYAKSIIIAAGNGAFQPRRLDLDNAEQYESKNLHYFVDDMEKFKDKHVVVFGGGDSAVDWALMLEPIAKEVVIVHRRDQFRAHEHSVENLKNSKAIIKTPYVHTRINGDKEAIREVVITNTTDNSEETIAVDDVLVTFGFVSSIGPIKEWGIEIDKNCIIVDSRQATSIPGIFAIGDIASYEGKANLIINGFGEAPIAINEAKKHVDPNAKISQLHSSSMFK